MTYQLTQGVVKNIIPAIASSNAIVSGMCATEALKIVTGCSTTMENYTMSHILERSGSNLTL